MEKTKQINQKNQIEVQPLDKLSNQQRIDAIVPELIAMVPKSKIITKYSKLWNCNRETVQAILQEAIVWLSKNTKFDREDMRVLNSERLEGLFGAAKTLKDKLRVLDMLNKVYGLYDTNINIGNKDKDEIKFNIGVK